jgi:hypothetical protein
MLSEAKGIQRQQRYPGIGEFSFRPSPEGKLAAAPATVVMLGLKQVLERPLKSAVAHITETA